jgi:hypothetical protein
VGGEGLEVGSLEEFQRLAVGIVRAAYDRHVPVRADRLDRETALVVVIEARRIALDEAIALAVSALGDQVDAGVVSAETGRAYAGDWARFAKFQQARRPVASTWDVLASDVRAFVDAPVVAGDAVRAGSASVRRRRHAAMRALFSEWRALGLYEADPLLDVALPPRGSLPYRPLTDDEVARCRFRSGRDRHDTRGPCAWALAEAYATTSEIPLVLIADVDRARRLVWLTGGARNTPRWAEPTEWGWERILVRIADLESHADVTEATPLIYGGTGATSGPRASGQSSASKALFETLVRAGLRDDRSARPLSIPAWRAVTLYAATGDLVAVRHALGVRSLDRAAEIVGAPIGWCDLAPDHRMGDR